MKYKKGDLIISKGNPIKRLGIVVEVKEEYNSSYLIHWFYRRERWYMDEERIKKVSKC